MKRVISIVVVAVLALPSFSQELSKKERKQMEKELKKEQQAEEAARMAEMVDMMVTHQRFVLEADRLTDKRGNTVNVISTINFVAADSIHGVVQIGSNSYVGSNGVGGVTVEGPITDYNYKKNKKNGTYSINYTLGTRVGTYDIQMSVFRNGRADATVTSMVWSGKIRYSGYLFPPGMSKVYKGTSF